MTDVRNIPPAIQWHEGMLLAPQHFQQAGLRSEALLQYHAMSISPYHWGIHDLKIDRTLLVTGILRIQILEALMPDGLIISHGEDETDHLEINLKSYAEEMRQKPMTVHLAVAAQKSSVDAFTGDLARYDSIEGSAVTDQNTGENELSIPRLKPRLILLATETPPQKYISFPIAQVSYQNEKFDLTNFIPPLLSVKLRFALGEMCSFVARRIREKAVFLSEQVRSSSTTGGMPIVLETRTMINHLVSALPSYEAVLNSEVAHPYTLYLTLCSLAGNLAGLSVGLVPPALEPYDHNNILGSFEQVVNYIHRVIDEGIQETYSSIPFQLKDNIFRLKFEEDWMERKLFLGVRAADGAVSEEDVISWIKRSWIGTESKIPEMQDKRILGPERIYIERDADIVPTRGTVLFNLKPDLNFILPEEELQIFNPGDAKTAGRPAEILLYVKKI